ncbi:MAG: Gfo/Idh/MocA family oxidoreductase [Proteiniphilum sp.]|nr:Gfo/Idh/MocA family oxidoreductase [Proteiniphilum sp.]MDD2936673.1 Gfo/Idh/MocA family oxidoreductase [Proteiniphilum sp.]MDD3075575.1 Gfo/Idh/MocA family oxidoreductase [Proteiniphilum sp.]MDD4451746.1 Gfo/Idh/MocA family oxidoreductase [Proteiniphilum sp.]
MIHWGFIGCGNVTEKKSGPAFSKVEGSDVVAVMRRDKDKAKDYARRHGVGKWYDNAADLINDPQVNAVYVATPPGSHAEHAIAAMRAGKPVYVEKPMAASYEECCRMNQVSAETGIPCFVAYYRRTLPYFLRVKQLIDDGLLGEISTVQIRFAIPPYATDYDRENLSWRVKKEIAGAGYFYDLASHQFDLLDFLFGEIAQTEGFSDNRAGLYDVEDTVAAAFRFHSGIVGSGSWSFVAPQDTRTDRIDVVGTKGKLSFSTFDFSTILLESASGIQEFSEANPENIQYYLIQQIVNYLNGRGELPVSTGATAQRTNCIMDEILG